MCEQLNKEPVEAECPPGFEDLPRALQQAIEVFNKLGDRVYPDIGYLGKDYTSLEIYMEIMQIQDRELFMEALLRLDAALIKKSAEDLKKARQAATKK